jgi:hypothetical protein
MAESMSQPDFYRNQGMHYMASQATTDDTDEDLFHDAHLQLQEQMRNPIMFHTEMMGVIMFLQQVPKLPDANCPSGHQGSQRTCGLQQLDAPEAKQSS